MTKALLLIDIQNAVLEGMGADDRVPVIQQAYDGVTKRLAAVLGKARSETVPVIIVQHDEAEGDPIARGSKGWEIRAEVAPLPGELLINKEACDAFFETPLEAELRSRGITHLVIGGCVTPFCIDTSVRRAVSLGFDVTLISDGHMSGDNGVLGFEQIIAHHNAVLGGFGAGPHGVRLSKAADISF